MLTTLDGAWKLRAVDGPIPPAIAGRVVAASVPGTVHTDLLTAGLVPDPFDGNNESALSWVGQVTWEYSREFSADLQANARFDLVCEGLDTVATISVNGAMVGHTVNQHRTYRFDLRPHLKGGVNQIAIRFDPAVEYAQRMEAIYGERPQSYRHPFNCIRKSACNFGWDWGIEAVTAGIWRSIGLDHWDEVRITSLVAAPDLRGSTGVLTVTAQLERTGRTPVSVDVEVAGSKVTAEVPPYAESLTLDVEVPDVAPWWPIGHGDQPLYEVTVRARTALVEDTHVRHVGFRNVRVNTVPDEDGSPFELFVNDELVVVRGVNWIPDDAFFPRVTPERYHTRIADAIDANINLLRVWGGGIYEADAFYEHCDRTGVLVWQDFLFACAAYTEDEPLRGEIELEAVDAVTRLSSHPSLVIWNGNNENIWGYAEWGWRQKLAGRSWGEGYYARLLPDIVRRVDGTRAYSPGSPFSFDRYLHPNDPANGTMHIWDVWNRRDYTTYAEYAPRFVSEFGFQGPPSWTTLRRVVHDEPLEPYGPEMLVHQKAVDGNLKLERGYLPHFPEPRSIEDWHWTTQLNQAHAVKFGIEYFRSLAPLNSGTIVWQLNDCWPVISWSAVDYDGYRKPLWYALRHAYSPQLATLQRGMDGLDLVVLNDSSDVVDKEACVRRVTLDGEVVEEAAILVHVGSRTGARLALPDGLTKTLGGQEALFCDVPGFERATLYGADVLHQELQRGAIEIDSGSDGVSSWVEVHATSVVRDLWLAADLLSDGAAVDSGLVHLLPGERHVFAVRGCPALPADILPALWSANRLL